MNAQDSSCDAAPQAFWAPDWGLEKLGVRVHLSLRDGGVSNAPYESMNLGLHVGDDPQSVEKNRALYQAHLGAKAVFFDQVHGTQCLPIDHASPNGLKADGAYTLEKGLACTKMVADCMPLLLADAKARVVAAVHVGWRGLVGLGEGGQLLPQGVIQSGVKQLRQTLQVHFGDEEPTLMAWLGPCIGANAFEVGPEVVQAFLKRNPQHQPFLVPHPHSPGKWLADLPNLVRHELLSLGVARQSGNDGSSLWCTVSRPDLYFSHRRDQKTGRFAASIWLA